MSRAKRPAKRHGILVVDKPAGISSFDVIRRVRPLVGERKIGHAGTLDPIASGVLVLCVGDATRIAGALLADDKRYEATAQLGVRYDTLDTTGEPLDSAPLGEFGREQVAQALLSFRGAIEQVPPQYSALRVDGKRAYERARAGEEVALEARRVTVHELSLDRVTLPDVSFTLHCSKGTYVRSLIRDFGEVLGCGAAMSGLRRVASGAFGIEQARTLEQLSREAEAGDVALLPIAAALPAHRAIPLDGEGLARIANGQTVSAGGAPGPVKLQFGEDVVAVGESDGRVAQPRRVFAGILSQLREQSRGRGS